MTPVTGLSGKKIRKEGERVRVKDDDNGGISRGAEKRVGSTRVCPSRVTHFPDSRPRSAISNSSFVPSVFLHSLVRVHEHRRNPSEGACLTDDCQEGASKRVTRGLEGDESPVLTPTLPLVASATAEPWSLVRPVYPVTARYA